MDVAARMVILLVDSGRVGVVCKWVQSIDRHTCRETLLQLSIAIGRMKRSDVDAAVRTLKLRAILWGVLALALQCYLCVPSETEVYIRLGDQSID